MRTEPHSAAVAVAEKQMAWGNTVAEVKVDSGLLQDGLDDLDVDKELLRWNLDLMLCHLSHLGLKQNIFNILMTYNQTLQRH